MTAPRRTLAFISLSAAAAIALPATAYVLPITPLLQQLQETREDSGAGSQLVEGTLVLSPEDAKRRILAAERSLLDDGRCRLQIVDTATEDLEGAHVVWDGRRVRASEHPGLGALLLLERMACPLSAAGGYARSELEELLDGLGVNRDYTGYSRLDGRVAYVIGARPWETDRPQVWLDKETFLPVRVMASIDGVRVDVRMLGYGEIVLGDIHPRLIEVHLDGRFEASFEAGRIERNVELSAGLFR